MSKFKIYDDEPTVCPMCGSLVILYLHETNLHTGQDKITKARCEDCKYEAKVEIEIYEETSNSDSRI